MYQADQQQGCDICITERTCAAQGTESQARSGSHAGQINVFEAGDGAGVLGAHQADQRQGGHIYITRHRRPAQWPEPQARSGSHAGQVNVPEAEDGAGVLAVADARGREEHRVQERHRRHVRGVLGQQLRRAAWGHTASLSLFPGMHPQSASPLKTCCASTAAPTLQGWMFCRGNALRYRWTLLAEWP